MTIQHQPVPDLRALLIGIDCYIPNELSDGTFYRSLAGCVTDILKVEKFLRSEFGLTDERLIRLTASRRGGDNESARGSGGDISPTEDERPTEPPEQWPTYDNIVQAFHQLEESARPGEQIYIHYSGHGGKVKTLPNHRLLIPDKFVDEALVPTDLGDNEGRYLRDVELAFLIQELVDKGLYVTIVLDSCHSGSATRGEEVGGRTPAHDDDVRGSDRIDNRPKPSLVASDKELTDNWQRLSNLGRHGYVSSEWLPDPKGYVLLAACRSNEGAHEFSFDGVNKEGALTYWVLESLKKFGHGATYQQLHRYIHAKVSEQFRAQEPPNPQNPQLEGEGDRVLFGREPVQAPFAFEVFTADEASGQVTLSAGRVHGLGAGARFALYSAGEVDFKQPEKRLAIAEMTELGVTSSAARLVSQASNRQVEQGDQAVLLAPGTDKPRYTVKVVGQEYTKPVEQIAQLLRRRNEGYVQLVERDETTDFVIIVSPHDHFRICDSSGTEVLNLRPALSVSDPNAPQRVVERLLHLAQYRNVRELENRDPSSPLLHKFSVEPLGIQALGTLSVKAGEWIFLHARNHYTEDEGITLNVTALNLRPDWSIQQVFPSRAGRFDTLEPTQELSVPLRFELPDGYEEEIDVIKFLVTVQPADFHFFELPPIDNPTAPDHANDSRSFERGSGDSQSHEVPLYLIEDWTTRQFEIRVTR